MISSILFAFNEYLFSLYNIINQWLRNILVSKQKI
jgi:hypothetical protein